MRKICSFWFVMCGIQCVAFFGIYALFHFFIFTVVLLPTWSSFFDLVMDFDSFILSLRYGTL
jgi:hypothetical protein